ncbi:protein-disulfide reductase DsbD family protein [Novosphingobium terrae]|uniref:protein-disulfide reductase DsbD family protein n=1 Tax=Novosphingobium terrae TaxID=2726189 RepID=UPI00197DB30F|nr:thioredoxin family protein [Novosphingobium terrae]
MLVALLSAFLGGLILNLMPCVFPVISLKIMGLVRHGDENPGQLKAEGLAFFAGVMVAMLALSGALIAARSGGAAVGWGFQLQSPLVIAVLALVMLGAGLNLAGLFEFGLAIQKIGQGSGKRSGPLGAALTGVLAIVVATPCSGPFMAGALGYALVQPPLVALGIFAALGLGFAAPFTLISFVPALAKRLPRPGAWMGTVKAVMAFPMFGAAAWLTWVLAQQAGNDGLLVLLSSFVALGFAAWLYGMGQKRRMMGQGFGGFYGGAGVVAALIAVAILRPAGGIPVHAEASPTLADAAPTAWSPEKVAALRKQGKPILIDFSASWCITCQVNEKTTLSTAEVKTALARTGTAYMVADSTKFDAKIQDAMAAYGRDSLPLTVLYPADGKEPVILPQVLSKSLLVDALDKASGKA